MQPTILAVDLGGTQIRAAPVTRTARYTAGPSAHAGRGRPESVIARIKDAVSEVIESVPGEQITGIGIGSPGPLDPMQVSSSARPTCPAGTTSRCAISSART